jgi:membrane fusion protein (multidrug efflux system)
MTRTTSARLAVLACMLGLLAGLAACSDGAETARPAATAAGAERTLRAEVVTVTPTTLQETVQTVGTLLANESVQIVPELSRRLVRVAVEEGTRVEAGALLFELDDADLRAQLAGLEVQRELAASTEQRQRSLLEYEKKALSQQAYDQAAAELRSLEAQIEGLRVTIARTDLRAPFAARVGLRRVSEGAWVTPDTVLTTLQDTSQLKVDFSVPERFADRVAVGQSFRFRASAGGEPLPGKVVALEPSIDAISRGLMVRGLAENPSERLLPGTFVSVELQLENSGDAILVPAEALVPSASGHSVFVLRDGRAVAQTVEIGVRTRESVQVISGLAPGERVITSNLLRLRAGDRVEPLERGGAPAS